MDKAAAEIVFNVKEMNSHTLYKRYKTQCAAVPKNPEQIYLNQHTSTIIKKSRNYRQVK